ncbi:hypothetical protein MVEN_00155100 [Mycena venus]|uniref:Uncharacterized protein n=1 Tax=Mycena venus TaxID=2733690 RepID=A0A8H7DCY2_9AGAR|nr:hypothetical protein MVEN_00155100 [Mycena venus]
MRVPFAFPLKEFPSLNRATYWVSTRAYTAHNNPASRGPRKPPLEHSSPHGYMMIYTLNPALLQFRDHLDLSRRQPTTIQFPTSQSDTLALLCYERHQRLDLPFPDRSSGFLYYHRDRHAAPCEGSIRLRVTSDDDPSSFSDGQDLHLLSGCPWQIILPQVACRRNLSRFRDQLLEESLVTEQQIAQCRRVFGDRKRILPETTLFRLAQEFPVSFTSGIYLTVVGEETHSFSFQEIFGVIYHGKRTFPWAGSALARFEPSARPEHLGRRVVHLRITKIVTPVSCNFEASIGRMMKPAEGELLNVFRHGPNPEPWAIDIDNTRSPAAPALRVLWETSPK